MKAKRYKKKVLCGMCDKEIIWKDKTPYNKSDKKNHFLSCSFVSDRRKRELRWEIKGI